MSLQNSWKETAKIHDQEHLVGKKVASRILDTPESTLAQWRHQGYGPPFYRMGKRGPIKYLPSELEAWKKSRKRTNTSDTEGADK